MELSADGTARISHQPEGMRGASLEAEVAVAEDTLSDTLPGEPVVIDAPDVNRPAVRLAEQLGLTPSFETARMYTGAPPHIDRVGLFGITSLELG
ncbi:acetyltransferase [Streptomyces sp. NPDC090445]|uniref:acetyltransferase n=1 Tax=Streptomyces sp. NPDC090445 TaxID=3365963 RepID=UPI0037FDDC92